MPKIAAKPPEAPGTRTLTVTTPESLSRVAPAARLARAASGGEQRWVSGSFNKEASPDAICGSRRFPQVQSKTSTSRRGREAENRPVAAKRSRD